MRRCRCGGFVPPGISRCPNCNAPHVRLGKAAVAAAAVAAQLITACACYGAAPCALNAVHRGMLVNECTVPDCVTALPDGGDPVADPEDRLCFGMPSARDGG